MKFLILFFLSFSLSAQSPEERRSTERLKDLQAFKTKECQGVQSDFCSHLKTEIKVAGKKSAKKIVAEIVHQADRKVNAEIAEENAFAKYTQLLLDEGSNNGACNKSNCLIKKYEKLLHDKRESECLANAKEQADSLSVVYLESDNCKQVKKKINDHLIANAPIGTATGG